MGQGDGDTKWKGCPWKTLLLKIYTVYKTSSLTQLLLFYLNNI